MECWEVTSEHKDIYVGLSQFQYSNNATVFNE